MIRLHKPAGQWAYLAAVFVPVTLIAAERLLPATFALAWSPVLLSFPLAIALACLTGVGPGLVATATATVGGAYFAVHGAGMATGSHPTHWAVFGAATVLILPLIATSQRRTERLYRDFAALVENTSDFVYFKDRNSRIRFCSQAMADMCGFADWREMIGKHDRDIFPAETARIYSDEELPVFNEGKPLLDKIDPYVDTRGRRGWINTCKWPVFAADNRTVIGLFGISRDITARKEAEDEVERHAKRSETLLRSSTDGVHILDAQGNLLEANDRFCWMLGYSREEMVGLNVSEWDAKWTPRELTNVILPHVMRQTAVFETRHRRKDGEILDVEISASSVEIAGEKLLFAASRDISTRKRMEEALQHSQLKIERIFRGAPVGIAEMSQRKITLANDRFCTTVGYSQSEVMGMPTRKLYANQADYERVGALFYTNAMQDESMQATVQFHRKDGRVIDVLLTMTAADPANPQAAATFMVMDVTASRQSALALQQSVDDLAESNRVKDIFTDVLRHDILNPASAVQCAAEVLAGMETDSVKKEVLEAIQESISRLIKLTQNAAKFAKMAALRDVEFAACDLQEILRDVLHDFGPQLRERDLTVDFAPEGPAVAEVGALIGDVFANLVSNAIKYGAPNTCIVLRLESVRDTWLISVADRGSGIAEADKERIFNRFERIGKQAAAGTGLGLTIAAQVVAMHAGKIWVEDNPQGGCVFRVQLPKRQALVAEQVACP
jgi:PAS domain S-box-containing protein